MVSAVARPYIDASVPVLLEHGLAITRTFYQNMFAAHPELTNLFNMGNQASGMQQQSLASAVFAYAANIDNAAALGPVVSRIVHKHASVGIRQEHYPIVGRHLLGAIQEVLGDAATPPLIAAWDEAYSELAAALIQTEKALYTQAGTTPGELRAMRVTEIRNECENVKSFLLQATDGRVVPAFKPGQYLSVSVSFDDGSTQLRQYSLSDAPNDHALRISIKRERAEENKPAGRVSNWLHDHIAVGDTIRVTHPFGDFTPDTKSDSPIALLSAGIGITPMISVLKRIAEANPARHVLFAHAARDSGHHAHRAETAKAQSIMPNLSVATFYEHASTEEIAQGVAFAGHMDVSRLTPWPYADASVYLCGPVAFMQAQWRSLIDIGVRANKLHREVFGPELLERFYLD